jgi:hypothetical protein
MTQHILLLGAGFSRNWGGWLADEVFEYLLGTSQFQQDKYLKSLLWKNKNKGGFEVALAELQIDCAKTQDQNKIKSLEGFYDAIKEMFLQMENGFAVQKGLQFRINVADASISGSTLEFLFKFDAIFSLNQDIILERHYFKKFEYFSKLAKQNRKNFTGFQIPGMRQRYYSEPDSLDIAEKIWDELQPGEFRLEGGLQPLFKLHGSFNWRCTDALQTYPLMILGGNKPKIINHFKILKWYHTEFERQLCQGETRLLIIGYGFGDEHINSLLKIAVMRHGLKIFIIDPLGINILQKHNPTLGGVITEKSKLEKILEPALIGASRRRLSETFGSDRVEFEKVMKFFSN